MPPWTAQLLEVQLAWTAVLWMIGGRLVVYGIDALLEVKTSRRSLLQTAHLRFRSLRFVGLTVVVVGLLTHATIQLVGKGTIYHWTLQTLWAAPIVLVVVVVWWWGPTIFELIALESRKGPLGRWGRSARGEALPWEA
jgi:hypothetical protein